MLLLTGATGYVGGRLLRRLEEEGLPVRCLCRDPEAPLASLPARMVRGDLLQPASLDSAFSGVDTAFYLVHSMNSGAGFEANEAASAANSPGGKQGRSAPHHLSGALARRHLSPHMRSRLETGNILRSGAIPALEFQASVIIGSGSASFELIRALVERLPVMITPRWVNTASQPIGIEDVIEYLIAGIRVPLPESVTVQIGGSDVTSYVGLMREFARQRKLPLVYTCSVPEPILIQPLADADHTGVCIHRPPPD